MYNVQAEMKKYRDTGDYSKNELIKLEEEMKQANKEERERKALEREEEKERKIKERAKMLGDYRNPKSGAFLHAKLAEDLVSDYPCININGSIAIWDGNSYTFNVLEFVRLKVPEYDNSTTKTNRNEVYNTIVDSAYKYPRFTEVDKYRIAFNNGVLNLNTLEFERGLHPEYAILNHLPHDYIEDVEEQTEVKKWLMNLADNDENVYNLLLQLVGYPMLVNCNLRTAFMLMGKAQGGKTKFVEHIQFLYGSSNYTTFDIAEINNRFNKAIGCGKLFNYSDDIDAGYIEKPNFLKRLISGQSLMQVEKKGIDGYGLPYYAKIIMSMNEFPKIKLDSDITAWKSRLNIINFKHKFNKNPRYDEWAEKTLRNPQAISWLIKVAVQAINKAVEKGEFCYYDDELFNKFIENINPILVKALDKTLDDWQEVYDVKVWYDEQKALNESKTSFNAFMKMFNSVSTTQEIRPTTKQSVTGKTIYLYKVREKK